MIDELLAYNKEFVKKKMYERYISDKFPNKKIAIITCMDTRLTQLLPNAPGLKNGDVKMIRNAGAVISSPFGSVMRSLIIAVYDLGVNEILVIGHHDCGMQYLDKGSMINKMKSRHLKDESLELIENCGVDLDTWLKSFDSVEESVSDTVNLIKTHPLMPKDISVFGLVIDPTNGKIEPV